MFLTARPLIRLAYGSAFDPSFAAVAGCCRASASSRSTPSYMNLLAACGMPAIIVHSPLIALAVNVPANLLLDTAWGFVGASVSSSFCYGLMLLMSVLYTRFRLLPSGHA